MLGREKVCRRQTAKSIAADLGKVPATASKWCTYAAQPSLETLHNITEVLAVDIRALLQPTKDDPIQYVTIVWQK